MSNAVHFITPGGEKLVLVSEEEYRRLVEAAEELAGIAAYDEARRAMAEGEELVPLEDAERDIARRLKDAS